MRRRPAPALLALALASIVALGGLGDGAALRADPAPSRIVAIGDIHGAWEPFVEILQRARLIDDDLDWIGGDTLLVQTGDVVDKGPDVRKVMDLLIALQTRARESGGRVVILMGNHEAMNLMGLNRDANPEAYGQFVDERSERRRKRAYRDHVRASRNRAERLGMEMPRFDDSTREEWMEQHPPGLVEYLEAMSSTGPYGRWIRNLPLMVQIDDLVFLHAGIGPDQATLSADQLNAKLKDDIHAFDAGRDDLIRKGVVLPSYSWAEMQQAIADEFHGLRERAERDEFILESDKEFMVELAEFLEFQGGVLTEPQGPLWFRGFARWEEEEGKAAIDQLSSVHGASAFVSSHTPRADSEIGVRFGGRVFLIDTGMLKSVYDGSASALEIRDGRFTAIYPDGEKPLLDTATADG